MSEQPTRPNLSHSEPVNFLPTPAAHVRTEVLDERRRYAKLMAESVAEMNKLHNAAYKDVLTGLGNRRMLDEKLPKLFEFAKNHDLPIALAYGDVRGLKRTNDNEGHAMGDLLLKAAGQSLKAIAREGDIPIHLSGDEFAIVLVGYTPLEGQSQEALDKDTISRLKKSFDQSAKEHSISEERQVGFDISITTMQEHDTPESLLARAETQMRAQKAAHYKALETQGITFQDNRVA